MIIININGVINSGKSTLSKILAKKLPNSIFIEVDDLTEENEFSDFKIRINERLNRLYEKLKLLIYDSKYDYIIFAYPVNNKSYQQIYEIANNKAKFIVATLNPHIDVCLTNRGTRELNDWEKNRIHEMYNEGYNSFSKSDIIIDNTNQTPEQTVSTIISYIANNIAFETPRLYTRQSNHNNQSDVDLLLNMHNNGEIMKYVGFPTGLHTTFEKEKEATKRKPRLLTYTKDTNEFIGYCNTGTKNEDGFYTIDIKLKPEFQGNGYGYELLQGLFKYIFEELKDGAGIETDPNPANVAAVKLYEKLGMKKTGKINHFKNEEMEFRTEIYRITKEEYENTAKQIAK